MKSWFRVALLLPLAAACTGPSQTSVPKGEWGGRNMDLIVDAAGVTVTFKSAAKGRVDQPLTVDGSGTFDLPGTYDPVLVLGGPRPARYAGALNGSTLQVTVTANGTAIGAFQLTQGRPASYAVCNF
jgi:hypothetical protein